MAFWRLAHLLKVRSVYQWKCTLLFITVWPLRVTPPWIPRLPSELTVTQRAEILALGTTSHWDKAGPLLTRPRPLPCIFPPTSVDYVVGGRAVTSFFSLSHNFSTAKSYPYWCSAISPNDIFAINSLLIEILSSGLDIINDGSKHHLLSSAVRPSQSDFAVPVWLYSIWPCKEMRDASGPCTRSEPFNLMQCKVMSEIREIHMEIKWAQIESVIIRGRGMHRYSSIEQQHCGTPLRVSSCQHQGETTTWLEP